MNDPFELNRFVVAQEPVMTRVRAELAAGRKQTHWMWFVFPQLRSLGRTETAQRYGIGSLDEARAYLGHPILGPRLRECCELMLAIERGSAIAILGRPDDLKLISSMSLFAAAAPSEAIFKRVLERFHAGRPDERTIELLGASDASPR
jgi:uncharacterized protein (DUF1810 family)